MRLRSFLIALLFFITPLAASSEVISGGVELYWPLADEQEREKIINNLREKLFVNVPQRVDIKQFENKKKDENFKVNRYAIKQKMFNLGDRKIAPFYFLNKLLYMYGVKNNTDKTHIYYYSALGKLNYVDIIDKPHDEYPNTSYQYNKKGKLVGVIYNVAEYDSYVFNKRGKFKGRWYNTKCYDKKAKVIMTRRLPE